MSKTYEDLINTNFPDDVDNLDYVNDITDSTYDLMVQYNTLIAAKKFEEAALLRADNPLLEKCIINADKINKMQEQIVAMQRYEKSDTKFMKKIEDIKIKCEELIGSSNSLVPTADITAAYDLNKNIVDAISRKTALFIYGGSRFGIKVPTIPTFDADSYDSGALGSLSLKGGYQAEDSNNGLALGCPISNINYTISFWLNIAEFKDSQPIFSAYSQSGNYFTFSANYDDYVGCKLGNTSVGASSITYKIVNNNELNLNRWNHITLVIKDSYIILYINDIKYELSYPIDSSLNCNLTGYNMYIGIDKTTNKSFNGMISDILIHNRALRSAEILQLYYKYIHYDYIPTKVNNELISIVAKNVQLKSQIDELTNKFLKTTTFGKSYGTGERELSSKDDFFIPLTLNSKNTEMQLFNINHYGEIEILEAGYYEVNASVRQTSTNNMASEKIASIHLNTSILLRSIDQTPRVETGTVNIDKIYNIGPAIFKLKQGDKLALYHQDMSGGGMVKLNDTYLQVKYIGPTS